MPSESDVIRKLLVYVIADFVEVSANTVVILKALIGNVPSLLVLSEPSPNLPKKTIFV